MKKEKSKKPFVTTSSTLQNESSPKPPPALSTIKDQQLALVTTEDHDPMTTNQGQPVGTDQNSLKAGHRGPTLMEDQILREKIQHFDHERIPERVVHARGAALNFPSGRVPAIRPVASSLTSLSIYPFPSASFISLETRATANGPNKHQPMKRRSWRRLRLVRP